MVITNWYNWREGGDLGGPSNQGEREAIRSLATLELIKIETIGGINREGICPTRYGPRKNLDNRSEKVVVASP